VTRTTLYERWVRDHSADLYRFAFRVTGDESAAEDLVQETYYEAWKSMKRLRDPSRARAWLFRILRRRHSAWRSAEIRARALTTPRPAGATGVESDAPDPAHRLAEQEELQRALDTLDERHKTPLLMVFVEGLTCRETASRLDLPLGTVLSRLHRAKARVRERLKVAKDAQERSGLDAHSPRLRLGGIE